MTCKIELLEFRDKNYPILSKDDTLKYWEQLENDHLLIKAKVEMNNPQESETRTTIIKIKT